MPKISVIMSVYNTNAIWLRESIESILNQTFKDFEFIIINDGSTNEDVEEAILSYQDSRIKYIKQQNQGLAKSLNNGLEIATGEYIARMDSDDISLPSRFEKQVDYLDNHSEVSILGTWFEIFPETQIIKHPEHPKYFDFLHHCCVAHPSVMFRRADFEKYNLKYNPEYKCEDYELWSRAIRYFEFANIQEVLLKYRWHENNLSKPTQDFIEHDLKVKKNMLSFLTNDLSKQEKIKEIIFNIEKKEEPKLSFVQQIFSVRNSQDKKRKIICILGLKIKIKRNK